MPKTSEGIVDSESVNRLKDRVNHFLLSAEEQEGKAKAGFVATSTSLTSPKEATKKVMMAVDNGMTMGVGFGLVAYLAKERIGKLKATEERFFIKQSEVPRELRCEEDVREMRSCIVDRSTNTTRLEVLWNLPRPALFQGTDQGSAGWSKNHFLYEKLCVRGGYMHDEAHRRHNNFLLSCKQAGLWYITLEFTVVLSWLKGPWGNNANYNMLREAALELFKNFDRRNPLFELLYEWIVLDLNKGVLPQLR